MGKKIYQVGPAMKEPLKAIIRDLTLENEVRCEENVRRGNSGPPMSYYVIVEVVSK
jgi:hypothetical protein